MSARTRSLGLAAIGMAFLFASSALAQPRLPMQNITRDVPILIRADEMRHERELGVIVARGNVEISQAERTLNADAVSYNQRSDIVTASGNVSLLEPSGDVLFADFMELTGDFRDGIVENLRMRMSGQARLAAAGARRIDGTRMEMRKAVYSACPLCPEDPERAPLWQVKAARVTHDQERKDIEYNDAFLEFFGVPVAYVPYLLHPDPTVRRRSGFLVPTYGKESQLGPLLRTPYYFDLGPNKDLTVAPIFTVNEGFLMSSEYRHLFTHGRFDGIASLTHASAGDDNQKLRGHADINSRFDLDEAWRAGAKIAYASDDTFMRRYRFGSQNTLVSRGFMEGFRGRNYAALNGYRFQGLRAFDDPGETPIVIPMLDFNHVGEPGDYGGRWSFDGNLLALHRIEGADSRRLSARTGWRLPYTTRLGEIYTAFASLQTDAYWVDEVPDPDRGGSDTYSGLAGRAFPQAGIDWRFPFVRAAGTSSQIVEPIVGFIVGPNGQNSVRIPNEDSVDFELDDTNIFNANRFTGLDRVDGGARTYYGLKGTVRLEGGEGSAFVAQSYKLHKDTTFSESSGLSDQFSDIVGRLAVLPSSLFRLVYRFRLDKDDLAPQRSEVSAQLGPPALNVGADYLLLDRLGGSSEFATKREEISLRLNSQITPRWGVRARTRRDLETGFTLGHGVRLIYDDDCFTFAPEYVRTFTSDRDLRPSESILFRIVLKTIGGFDTSASP